MRGNIETLTEFTQEIFRTQEAKHDYVVPAQKIRMMDDSEIAIEGTGQFAVGDVMHSQISEKLEIPRKYYDRMTAIPGLRTTNVNAWLENSRKRHMVRTLDGRARALLSDRFRPYDHVILVAGALPILDRNDVKVTASALTESRMYLQVVFPKIQGEVKVGDVVQAGVTITNSEVGKGSVDVSTFLYRLRCLNGMIGESLLNKTHVGRRIGDDIDDYDKFRDDTIEAEIKALELKFRDILEYAISEASFHARVGKLQEAEGMQLTSPTAAVEEVTKRFCLSEEEGKAVADGIYREGATVWGLANSVTALAHKIDNRDRQYEVERHGNDIIQHAAEWRDVA